MSKQSGKSILVIGGSGGIGSALCRKLATTGICPIISFFKKKEFADNLALQTRGESVCIDLTNEDSIRAAAEEIANYSNLEGVIISASPVPTLESFTKIDHDDARNQWLVNVAGPHRLLQLIIGSNFKKKSEVL